MRDVQIYADAIKARVPGLSKPLPARYNLFGEPMRGDDPATELHVNRMSPVKNKGAAAPDSVSDALFALGNGFAFVPRRTAGGAVDLADKPYADDNGNTPWDLLQSVPPDGGDGRASLRDDLSDLIQPQKWQDASLRSEQFPAASAGTWRKRS